MIATMGNFKTCLSTWATIAPAIFADGLEGEGAEVPQPKGKAFPRASRVELSTGNYFPYSENASRRATCRGDVAIAVATCSSIEVLSFR